MGNLMQVAHPSADQRGRELPYDLIREILLKAPIRSLLRFKCVCKFWYDLIISSDFVIKYKKKNDNENHKFSIFLENIVCSADATSTTMWFRFFDVPVKLTVPFHAQFDKVVGCSNGLVCLSFSTYDHPSFTLKSFIVWNPATGRFRQIDPHTRQDFSCGFCYDLAAGTFKVTQIEFSVRNVEINMFQSKDNCWSSENRDNVHRASKCMGNTVCVGTCMYWERIIYYQGHESILCFDMANELFRFINLPNLPNNRDYYRNFVCYKETVAFFVCRKRGGCPSYKFDVWVMLKDDGGESWSKQMTCRPTEDVLYAEGFLCKGEVNRIVVTSSSCVSLYDPKTGYSSKFMQQHGRTELKFHPYCESFALVY